MATRLGDDFRNLFEPIDIGRISVKNRIMMPGMATCLATSDGFVTDQMVSYYAKRAEGGVGLIILGSVCIDDPVGKCIPNELCIDGDQYIPRLRWLTEAVHSYGAKIAAQLHHAGPNSHVEGGAQTVAPSPIPLANMPHAIPRELSKEEIKAIVKKHALGARRAKQAGFDAIELLCAHGYFFNRFLSPHANKRQDEYGGSREGRMKILQETIESIRIEAGRGFPILCKVPGDDYVEGGITLEESIALSKILEESGVDALIITGGSCEGRFHHIGPMGYPQGWLVHLAQKVKQNVKIPVAAIGKINRFEFAQKILEDGKADIIAIGRALIADPELVVKSQRNEVDSIIPCISCNSCLERIVNGGKPLRCSVNPITGKEYETHVLPAARSRKIFVVGGGPAGMQAAIVASSRGHDVVLFEKSDKVGGQMLLAAMGPEKKEIASFIKYLHGQLEKRGIVVKLNTKVTRQIVDRLNPEVVISATGALPLIPPFSGVELDNVVSAWDTLVHAEKVANKVVIIGGGMVGCEVASYLSEQGKKPTIVEQLEDIGLDIELRLRKVIAEGLRKTGVTIMTRTIVRGITKEGVIVDCNGESKVIAADTVVLAVGHRSDRTLLGELETAKVEVHVIGDCVVPRNILQATSQGFHIGCCL